MRARSGNKSRRAAICLLLVSAVQPALAQTSSQPATSPPPAPPLDNYTIQRLIVTNDKREVLMEQNKFGWMTPAIRSNKDQSIKEALGGLLSSLGITADRISLSGVFTYRFKETPPDPAHAAISFRTHYTAKYKSGRVIQPTDADKKYKWVSQDEISKLITMDSLRSETIQILRHPRVLWGGSFLVTFEGGAMKSTEALEEFYPLRTP